MLEKEFVPYQESLELKELGFDEPCFGFYTEEYKNLIKTFCKYPINLPTKPFLAPTFSQAFRWFRDEHKLSGVPTHHSFEIWNLKTEECIVEVYPIFSYEEAELACLRKLIEIVKK